MPKGKKGGKRDTKYEPEEVSDEEDKAMPVSERKPAPKALKQFISANVGNVKSLKELKKLLMKCDSTKRLVNALVKHIFIEIS
jgi:hypothetical protein